MPAHPPARRDEGDDEGVLELRLGGHEENGDDAESLVLLTDEELEAEEWGPPSSASVRS
jgi:hypothetical protein